MPLLDLRTNLKSLKYGNDRPGGGDSGQPYIKKPLYADPNKIPVGNGVVLASIHTLEDISRLTKMFFDLKSPNGPLFILNQNLLSRTGVKTQASGLINDGVYLPTSTLAQAGVSAAGLHFNKQGINPGPGTFGSRTTYSDVVTNDQEDNRLVNFYNNKILSVSVGDIWSYGGGPGSVLGIGPTHIRFADQRTGISNTKYNEPFFTGKEKKSIVFKDSDSFFGLTNTYNKYAAFKDKDKIQLVQSFDFNPSVYDPLIEGNTWPDANLTLLNQNNTLVYRQDDIISASSTINVNKDAPSYTPEIQDFRALLRTSINNTSTVMSDAPDYSNQNIETRVNIGGTLTKQGPGYKAGKNLYSYTNGSGIGPIDRINAHPIYYSGNVNRNGNGNAPTSAPINDLVKFRIASIDAGKPTSKTFMHFRAFLNSITDNYSAAWNPYNYVGRGEKFYSYGGFDRTLSLSWTVAAQSREELSPMYKKLNYLASTLAPSYSPSGYMRGPLVQLTIGGYVYEQVGFITGLTFEINEDSPWEIGITDKGINTATDEYDSKVKELPHYIKVRSFNFTPIHNFVPKTQNIKDWKGPSRFIALSDGGNNNLYDKPGSLEGKPYSGKYKSPISGRIAEEIIDLPIIYSQITNPFDQPTLRGLDGLSIA